MGMNRQRFVAVRDENCLHCGFCEDYLDCLRNESGCIGCGICIKGCPQGARSLVVRSNPSPRIQCTVNGKQYITEASGSVLELLKRLGKKADKGVAIAGGDHDSLCGTGGCWSCAVLVDGILSRSCVTPLRQGMEIVTDGEALFSIEPRRIATIMRPYPHHHPTIFVHGCNYHCGSCHNWDMTFASRGRALTPREAFALLRLDPQQDYWVGISGGEPTLNRRWLVETVREIRKAGEDIRIQLDTNASLLTPDYIDELARAGVSDISPDLKALHLDPFMQLTGIHSKKTARQYLDTSWNAVRYLYEVYRGRIFTAVSLPYHPGIHSQRELEQSARTLADIDPDMPVTLIEYQPAFRLRNWPFIPAEDMEEARRTVTASGLHRVILQGGAELPVAVDPLELAVGSEEF
jgi:pyruvate formate lyase activating enzyme